MTQRMAIYMQDRIDIREELDLALYMEDRGFSEIWQGDNRLARDCIVAMSAFLTHTSHIKVAAGVLPIWTRNPVVIAASFSTMWELGGKVDGQGRVMLGLGAWMAVGTAEDCRRKVRQYVDAGVTCPIMYPLRGNIREVIDAFADGF